MKSVFVGVVFTLAALFFSPAALAQAGAVTLQGQVVCSDCWFEEKDRKANPYDESELACAARCSKAGIPQALAVWEGNKATLYLLENGAFKKEGKDFLAFVTKQVEATGTTRTAGDKRYLKVDALKVIGDAPTPAGGSAAVPALGSPAPAVALPDLSGQEQSLAGYKGKIVVLNFWATWCAPCRKEMPAFVAIQNEYAAWGVQVIAASADTEETRGQVVKFVRDRKLSFPVWTGATKDHMLAFGLGEELPGTAIIDRDGKVVARFKGMIKEADLKREIDALLQKQHAEHEKNATEGAAKESATAAPMGDPHGHGKAGEPIGAKGKNRSSVPS